MSGPPEQFATVAEHIAAWKAGGRRWARVDGFNVDAMHAERDLAAKATVDLREPPQWAIDGAARVQASIDRKTLRLGSFAASVDTLLAPCPTCGAVRR